MTLLKKVLTAAAFAGSLVAVSAQAAYITDNYTGRDTNWGADASNDPANSNKDVIGNTYFEVYGAKVDLTGSLLTVLIDTNFYENLGRNKYYGDLFISTNGYNGAGDSSQDYGVTALNNGTATSGTRGGANGEIWEYAFDTDGGQLLDLSANTIFDQGTHRQGQEVRIDRALNTNTTSVIANNNSSFTDHGGNSTNQVGINGWNLLEYQIDLSFLGTVSKSDLAFHWTMYCGNDVIESRVSEPSSIALLSLGLLGLAAIRRKKS